MMIKEQQILLIETSIPIEDTRFYWLYENHSILDQLKNRWRIEPETEPKRNY